MLKAPCTKCGDALPSTLLHGTWERPVCGPCLEREHVKSTVRDAVKDVFGGDVGIYEAGEEKPQHDR